MLVIRAVDWCSCGSIQLWIGAMDRCNYGSELWIGAVDRSCGSVQLWIDAYDRSCGSVLVTEMMWIGACDREGERWV